jgi:hypothetical protein
MSSPTASYCHTSSKLINVIHPVGITVHLKNHPLLQSVSDIFKEFIISYCDDDSARQAFTSRVACKGTEDGTAHAREFP